jgi:hypothetical protein
MRSVMSARSSSGVQEADADVVYLMASTSPSVLALTESAPDPSPQAVDQRTQDRDDYAVLNGPEEAGQNQIRLRCDSAAGLPGHRLTRITFHFPQLPRLSRARTRNS